MTVAELIAELEQLSPETLVLMEHEHHGWWDLDCINGLQDKWVVANKGAFDSVEEGTPGAVRAIRVW